MVWVAVALLIASAKPRCSASEYSLHLDRSMNARPRATSLCIVQESGGTPAYQGQTVFLEWQSPHARSRTERTGAGTCEPANRDFPTTEWLLALIEVSLVTASVMGTIASNPNRLCLSRAELGARMLI